MSSTSWFAAPQLGIVIALLGNLIGLAVWPRARVAPQLPWVEFVLALLLCALGAPSIMLRAYHQAKRGMWSADFVALVAAFASLGVGAASLFVPETVIPLTPNFLLHFGPRPDGASALAFEGAGAIIGFVFLANQVQVALLQRPLGDLERTLQQRYAKVCRVLPDGSEMFGPCVLVAPGDRLRLLMGDVVPIDLRLDGGARVATNAGRVEDRCSGQWVFRGERLVSVVATGRIENTLRMDVGAEAEAEVARETQRIQDVAWRREGERFDTLVTLTLTIAMAWFAVFAVVVHAASTRAQMHPGVALAGVAVLAGASPVAFMFGIPIARVAAVLEARTKGIIVKDAAALDTLATVDDALFDLTGHVFLDAPKALRDLWHRDITCRLLRRDRPDVTTALGHRFGVVTTNGPTLERRTEAFGASRTRRGSALLVGPSDTAQMIPVDLMVVVAPNDRPSKVVAPIVLRVPSLPLVVWLIDTARRLHARSRLILVLTLVYAGVVIPLCALGLLRPLVAATLSFGFTMTTYWLAMRE